MNVGNGQIGRGAVTLGPIYHTRSVVFGPAFIEAYKLERASAVYPRILLADKLLTSFDLMTDRSDAEGDGPVLNVKMACQRLLRRDQDGIYFIDFLKCGMRGLGHMIARRSATIDIVDRRNRLVEARESVVSDLSSKSGSDREGDVKIVQKLAWFLNYIDTVLAENAPH